MAIACCSRSSRLMKNIVARAWPTACVMQSSALPDMGASRTPRSQSHAQLRAIVLYRPPSQTYMMCTNKSIGKSFRAMLSHFSTYRVADRLSAEVNVCIVIEQASA